MLLMNQDETFSCLSGGGIIKPWPGSTVGRDVGEGGGGGGRGEGRRDRGRIKHTGFHQYTSYTPNKCTTGQWWCLVGWEAHGKS
jgi:hypothetical protein